MVSCFGWFFSPNFHHVSDRLLLQEVSSILFALGLSVTSPGLCVYSEREVG